MKILKTNVLTYSWLEGVKGCLFIFIHIQYFDLFPVSYVTYLPRGLGILKTNGNEKEELPGPAEFWSEQENVKDHQPITEKYCRLKLAVYIQFFSPK